MDPKKLRRASILTVSAVLILGMTVYAEGHDTARDAAVLKPGLYRRLRKCCLGRRAAEDVTAEYSFRDRNSKTWAIETEPWNGISETGYRMKPLLDKLAAMDSDEVEACAGRFRDMDRHWSRQVVGKLAALDIIAGMGDGSFRPDNPVTADQFIKMAVMAMGHKIEQGTGYWAKPYIDAAMEEGIISDGEFTDYKKPLSREEMARIIVRTALKVEEAPGSEYDGYIIGKIADYESIDNSLKQYVLDGYKLGLVQGSNNKYHPKDTLTRAEATAVIIRILDKTERKPTVPGPDEVIKLVDNLGNPMVIYPGPIREYFEIEKAMEKALPKAKGYAVCFTALKTVRLC
ncbi:MAG: S-layer homology domain-containing protein [Acetivibrionales bacterium]